MKARSQLLTANDPKLFHKNRNIIHRSPDHRQLPNPCTEFHLPEGPSYTSCASLLQSIPESYYTAPVFHPRSGFILVARLEAPPNLKEQNGQQ